MLLKTTTNKKELLSCRKKKPTRIRNYTVSLWGNQQQRPAQYYICKRLLHIWCIFKCMLANKLCVKEAFEEAQHVFRETPRSINGFHVSSFLCLDMICWWLSASQTVGGTMLLLSLAHPIEKLFNVDNMSSSLSSSSLTNIGLSPFGCALCATDVRDVLNNIHIPTTTTKATATTTKRLPDVLTKTHKGFDFQNKTNANEMNADEMICLAVIFVWA